MDNDYKKTPEQGIKSSRQGLKLCVKDDKDQVLLIQFEDAGDLSVGQYRNVAVAIRAPVDQFLPGPGFTIIIACK